MRSLDDLRVQAFDVLAVHSGCPFGGSAIAVPGVDLSLARSSGGVQASLSLAVWGCPALTDRRSAPRSAIARDCHAMNRGLRRSRSRRDRRADPWRRLHCPHDTAPTHSASPDQCADRRSTISKAAGQDAVRSTDPPRVSQVRLQSVTRIPCRWAVGVPPIADSGHAQWPPGRGAQVVQMIQLWPRARPAPVAGRSASRWLLLHAVPALPVGQRG